MTTPEDVIGFWIDEIGPEGWYKGSAAIDRACADRLGEAAAAAAAGHHRDWLATPRGALAYLVLTDQMPRNIHRDHANSFSADARARAATVLALARGHDLKIDPPARQFFYLPYMHSESLQHQALSVCLFLTRMPARGGQNLLHARAHREVIRLFSRFPYRNAALGRESSPAEVAFLRDTGYGGIVTQLEG